MYNLLFIYIKLNMWSYLTKVFGVMPLTSDPLTALHQLQKRRVTFSPLVTLKKMKTTAEGLRSRSNRCHQMLA